MIAGKPELLEFRQPVFEDEHITAALERFLSDSATREEIRAVVRHLLAQCPSCGTSARRSLLRSPLLVLLFCEMANQK
jgi:hypothetical protein